MRIESAVLKLGRQLGAQWKVEVAVTSPDVICATWEGDNCRFEEARKDVPATFPVHGGYVVIAKDS